MKKRILLIVALLLVVSSVGMAAGTADVIFVVDESGSMNTEHGWIAGMVASLDAGLVNAGVTGNQYGLVGFGSYPHTGNPQLAHLHNLGVMSGIGAVATGHG